jgi:hypothetical protein
VAVILVSGNEDDEDFGAEKDDDDDGDDNKSFALPFNRLAMRSAALLLFILFDTLSDALSLVADAVVGVPVCCCFFNCFVLIEAELLLLLLLLKVDALEFGVNVCCCPLLFDADIWRCIELAAAAANRVARVVPPSAILLDGDGGTAVGEAVIVRGASLSEFENKPLV